MRLLRRVLSVIVVALLVGLAYRSAAGLLDGGCDTTLCCEDCDLIPVDRVIDGDTFVTGETGVTNGDWVRLYGMDTPERGERCFAEATDRLRLLAEHSVRVETGPRSHDRYGRLLFYVYTESGDSIDERLVREGFARAWTQDGQHRDRLVELEDEARMAGKGCLWETSPEGRATSPWA